MKTGPSPLAALIRDASRAAFDELRRAHPGETFYAFALYTDGGYMTIMPSANSEERFAEKAAETSDPRTRTYYRWATAEWAYEAAGSKHFDEAHRVLDASPPASGDLLIADMVEALRQLDAEGFFGTGAARERVTLFVSISDDDDALKVETRSAKQLNPPGVAAVFAKRYG